jgi:mRNA-degrading endonuclease toxin of MazEF toxin-antitoxin module
MTYRMGIFLADDSIILAHQIRTLSKDRLSKFLGTVKNPRLQSAIDDSVRIHLKL